MADQFSDLLFRPSTRKRRPSFQDAVPPPINTMISNPFVVMSTIILDFNNVKRHFLMLGEAHSYNLTGAEAYKLTSVFRGVLSAATRQGVCVDVFLEMQMGSQYQLGDKSVSLHPQQGGMTCSLDTVAVAVASPEAIRDVAWPTVAHAPVPVRLPHSRGLSRVHFWDTRTFYATAGKFNKSIASLYTNMWPYLTDLQKFQFETFSRTIIHFIQARHSVEWTKETLKSVVIMVKEFKTMEIPVKDTVAYYMNLRDRIWKEFDKIQMPAAVKRTIEPAELFNKLQDPLLFETDIYLFYRMLITFNARGLEAEAYPACPRTPEHSIVYGGAKHMANIMLCMTHLLKSNQDFITGVPVTKKYTSDPVDLDELLPNFGLNPVHSPLVSQAAAPAATPTNHKRKKKSSASAGGASAGGASKPPGGESKSPGGESKSPGGESKSSIV
jgi:hypothetical protein